MLTHPRNCRWEYPLSGILLLRQGTAWQLLARMLRLQALPYKPAEKFDRTMALYERRMQTGKEGTSP